MRGTEVEGLPLWRDDLQHALARSHAGGGDQCLKRGASSADEEDVGEDVIQAWRPQRVASRRGRMRLAVDQGRVTAINPSLTASTAASLQQLVL